MRLSLADRFAQEEETRVARTPLSKIFDEEPVSLDVFIKDQQFLNADWRLSPIQYQAIQHIERVFKPEMYPLMAEEFGGYWAEDIRMTNFLTLQWGKGSGKDAICRIASLRVAYLLLCMKNPLKYFEMPEDDSIHLLNIAHNSAQAQRAFFVPMTNTVKKGWFADKAEAKQGEIKYDKNIYAISGHSDAESQEGLNILLGVADEIDAFKAKEEQVGAGTRLREASTSAESILEMLASSAATRFPGTFKRVAISFPRYLGSTIQKLTFEGQQDNEKEGADSRYYVSGPYATWEVNPRIKGKHEYETFYRKDPADAQGRFECKPTRAMDPYFRNPDIFKQSVVEPEQPVTVSYKLNTTTSAITGKETTGWEPVFTFAESFKPIQGARYALHGDMAVTGDRAGIAMSHVVEYVQRDDIVVAEDGEHIQQSTEAPIVKNDFTFSFGADIGETPPREIQIRWARMLAFELIKRGFPIARFTFDGFQSVDTIQILLKHGIESERVSADINDFVWKNLKDVASESRLRMPMNQKLLNELEALSKIKNKVDHPPGGSKDEADAFACSISGAIEAGGSEDPNGLVAEISASFFETGNLGQSPEGFDELDVMMNNGLSGLPMGMKGMSFHG